MEDFIICLDVKKGCEPGSERLRVGRLLDALDPILTPEDEKNYRHKSEAEIARMSPAQRLDEEIMEGTHRSMSHDDYHLLIQRYRRKDGLKGWARLIELIDSYHPKRPSLSRFYRAEMIAGDIDERAVRLRGSTEGKRVIEAVERLATRMRAAGKDIQASEWMLGYAKGVNPTDQAIRDTLWVKYRIKMSDSELLEFSNYLIARDPTYPGWSQQSYITDYSRKNKAGYHLQVHIMKRPTRYYQAYRKFRQRR